MKSSKLLSLLSIFAIAVGMTSCNTAASQNSSGTSAPQVSGLTNGTTITAPTGTNVMSFTINGSTCASGSNINMPCVSLTICNAGSISVCQTVNNILLDTGSYGLRVYRSAISSLAPTAVTASGGGNLGNCAGFGDGTKLWGQVMKVNVTLGAESPITIPIQVIDSAYGVVPTACSNPDSSPTVSGFNGILGVGLEPNDCGSSCLSTGHGYYYSCSGGNTGSGLSSTAAACPTSGSGTLANQVQNPVSSLPADNNGLLIRLPAISTSGATGVTGYAIFGIGTQTNNTPSSSALKYVADGYANLISNFNGTDYDGFLDTGSNGLFFPGPSSLPTCSGWYCPTTVTAYSVTNRGADNTSSTPRGTANFQIANSTQLFNSGYNVYNDLGASATEMDLGLPFYFGRDVYVIIDGKTASSYGAGPAWVY